MWDMTSLLSAVYESKVATSMYNKMESTVYTDRSRPDSSRLAFDSQMRQSAATYRVASQNMSDAVGMVTVAQSGVTTMKETLNEMYNYAKELGILSGVSSDEYAYASNTLEELANSLVTLTNEVSFNGFNLLDGSAGMNADGTVVLQGGNSQIDQDFVNFVDESVTGVMSTTNSNMNLNNLKNEVTITDKDSANALAEKLEDYIHRLESIEANYSYDIKGLENLSVLYEDRANTFENTIQYKNTEEQASGVDTQQLLDDLINANQSNGNIFDSLS